MKEIVVDINKPLKAKVYGFDRAWYEAEGEDEGGEYIIADVQGIMLPHGPYQKYVELMTNSGRYDNFRLLLQN